MLPEITLKTWETSWNNQVNKEKNALKMQNQFSLNTSQYIGSYITPINYLLVLSSPLDEVFKCVAEGNVDAFKELISKNKKLVFARDKDGKSPLHMAAEKGHVDIIKAIVAENPEFTQITDSVSYAISKQFLCDQPKKAI